MFSSTEYLEKPRLLHGEYLLLELGSSSLDGQGFKK